jgi:hypothetical protein
MNRYGEIAATKFYDINNTAYYLDPSSTGTSLLVAGSVGIGVTSALASLDVASPTTATYNRVIKVGSGSGTDGNGNYIEFPSSSNDGIGSRIGGTRVGAGGKSDLIFQTVNALSVNSTKMLIDGDGKVGIGVLAPTYTLDVSESTAIGSRFSGIAARNNPVFKIETTGTTGGSAGVLQGLLVDIIGNGNAGSDAAYIAQFKQGGVSALSVKGSGAVGIGIVDPGSYKLRVEGNTFINGTIAATLFQDASNGTYYLDPASTTTSLNIAGEIAMASGKDLVMGGLNILSSDGTNNYLKVGVGMYIENQASSVLGVIKSTGELGLGTNSPLAVLHTKNSTALSTEVDSAYAALFETNSYSGIKVRSTGTGYAPANIFLEATSDTNRGQGVFMDNTVDNRI